MLDITKTINGNELTVALKGRLDSTTSPDFEKELKAALDGVGSLVIDMTELEYISSAGLRVLLSAQKVMNQQGNMLVKNPSEIVKEVFDVTGFCDILNIQA